MYKPLVTGTALVLSLGLPLTGMAGEIVDTYSSGDTLTATMMNNIKAAVNDNNTASRFYGDGSAGNLTVANGVTVDLDSNPQANLNFENVVIEAGGTLIVPAGTTIRCTGNFVNNGTITVTTFGKTGYRTYAASNTVGTYTETGVPASPGDTSASSQPGALGTMGFLGSGDGGLGIHPSAAASTFMSFRWGGGSGSAAMYEGGPGGGLLKVLCRGEVRNEAGAGINASGSDVKFFRGPGGGGGGIVVLASQEAVVNAGSIDVSGGDGGDGDARSGAGGGGGGGIVILVAPKVTNTGTVDVSGGAAGLEDADTGTSSGVIRFAGSGGGGSGGAGGHGSTLDSSGVNTPATDGEDGYVLEINANPATMM